MRFFLQILGLSAALSLGGGAWAAESQAMADVRVLSADDMAGRGAGTPGSARARAYILSRMKSLGLEPAYGAFEQPFGYETKGEKRSGVNLVGRIAGTGASDRVLVISAHYDHLGIQKGEIYNGADDNASGVAGLLAVAEAFAKAPPKHTTIFAIVDAEEQGHAGSREFVARPPVPLEKIALNINFDMLSKSAKGELYVAGGHHFPWLKPRFARLATDAPVSLKQGHDGPPWTGDDDWTKGSDHHVFHLKGVPWVYFGVEDHPEYHKPTDDFASVPQAFFDNAVATAVMAARLFDEDLDAVAKDAGR